MQVLRDGYEVGISLSLIRFGGCFTLREELLIALPQILQRRRRVLEEGCVWHPGWCQLRRFGETPLVGFLAFGVLDLTLSSVF